MKPFHLLGCYCYQPVLPIHPQAIGPQTLTYFQQEVNYTIAVTLDDVKHSIKGNVEFEYINNAPDTLPKSGCICGEMLSKTAKRHFANKNSATATAAFIFPTTKTWANIKTWISLRTGKNCLEI